MLEIQNELAIERAAAAGLCRLVWIPTGPRSYDERQRAVLEQLRNDPRLDEGADLLETFLEDLRTQIRRDSTRRTSPCRAGVHSAGGATAPRRRIGNRTVYLIYDQRDADVV